MNYKLEKFWNSNTENIYYKIQEMNYKLEKFWNSVKKSLQDIETLWTINLKSFEIRFYLSFYFQNLHEL